MQFPSQLPYILSISDFFLAPLYIVILFFIVKRLRNKYYADSPLRVFILPAFFVHVISCILFALLYQYYYGYGDMYGYFTGAHEIWEAFLRNPKIALELIFVNREHFSQTALDWAPYSSFTGFAEQSSVMYKTAGSVGLFCFGSYLPIAIIFSLFSLWGSWLIYITLNKYFPHLYKYLGLACLFIPSFIIWTSGINKEPLCMFALGLCFYTMDNILRRRRLIKNIFYFFLGSVILLAIKNYLFFTFAIASIVWVLSYITSHIKSYFGRVVVRSLILITLGTISIYFINTFQQTLTEGISRGEKLQELMTTVNEEAGGSAYTLPQFSFTFGGILKSFFLSINVTLFRPYLWECKNVFMLMSFLESFGTLLLVLTVFFKAGVRKISAYCRQYPVLFFMLVFSLILAPIVGFISFNFGTLVRYKIPFLPFLASFLVIVLFDKKKEISKVI